MTAPAGSDESPGGDNGRRGSAKNRARRSLAGARRRYEGSWVDALVAQLKVLDIGEWTLVFGAELLWSVLPLLILLSSLANDRIDDDLSRHIGLNKAGAHVIRAMFRSRPSHELVPILTGLLFSFAGTVAVVGSIQILYERTFHQQRRQRRDLRNLPRLLVWVLVLVALLVGQALIQGSLRTAVGPVVLPLIRVVELTVFFWWTMHFLLKGRTAWRVLLRPAIVTAILWLGLAVFSSLYFSSVIVSDSKEYGEIGVAFGLLTWFVLIGAVFVLGATLGAVWQQRRGAPWPASTGTP